jgi:hypothetical protein
MADHAIRKIPDDGQSRVLVHPDHVHGASIDAIAAASAEPFVYL